MAMKDRMHTGALYLPGDDEIMDRQRLCLDRLYEFNHTRPTETDKRQALMKEMFAELGENCYIEPPFYSNFGGAHVHLGNHVYCNFAVTMVDDTHIYIGDNTMIAPNVTIATAGHPVLPELRADLPYLWTQTAAFLKKYLSAGFVFFGGLYGALAAALLYARLTRTSAERLLNMLLPAVLLIHGLGRVGCFCMGCCYGKPSEKWGVLFSRSEIAPSDVPLLPIQLYEAAGVLLLFGVLAHMGAKKTNGFRMLAVYLLAYSILRFGLEYLRGDAYRGFLLGLSVSQMLSIASVLLAGFLLLRLRGRRACGAA